MSRTRMDWDWVKDYPIFVYTTFIDHFKFHVKIVKGEKGNQNAPGYGPQAPAWHSYIQEGMQSKAEVVHMALKIAKRKIKGEKIIKKTKEEVKLRWNFLNY